MTPASNNAIQLAFERASLLNEADRVSFLEALDLKTRLDVEGLLLQQVAQRTLEKDEFATVVPEPAETIIPITRLNPIEPDYEDLITKKRTVVIGPYRLLQQIGQGGMGTVFLAEQSQPVRRRVALKLIRAGMGNQDVITRFEAERQAAAMMNHPNIAKVLDVGTTEDGRPYFVMELVHGIPITEYCDNRRLGLTCRLDLFQQVCRAIQHAHQKGIIHRDLKPSNVLVGEHDGRATVKVIDFGLAKALHSSHRLTDKTMFTEFGQVLGTLQYMSPEQAELNASDVDTRSDVYSLGILLYELLTGSTPIEKQRLKELALDRVLAAIREEEAPRPSHRLSSIGESAAGISLQRQTDPRRLGQILKGDLDWIAIKALEKDRARRYDSPVQLAEDIQRYVQGEAVIARPPSVAYRLRKVLRRHRFATASLASVFLFLVFGIVVTTSQMLRARRAEAELKNVSILLAKEIARQQDPKFAKMVWESLLNKRDVDARDLQLRTIICSGRRKSGEGQPVDVVYNVFLNEAEVLALPEGSPAPLAADISLPETNDGLVSTELLHAISNLSNQKTAGEIRQNIAPSMVGD